MSTEAHLKSFALEALANGVPRALEPETLAEATAHLATCERCRAELEEAKVMRARFSSAVLPRTVAKLSEKVAEQTRPHPLRPWRFAPLVLGPALAAALLIWLPGHPAIPELGYKGAAALRLYAQRGDRVFQVEPRDTLRPGDRIRFEVEPGGLPFLMIAAIDGAGHPTIYAPYGAIESLSVSPTQSFRSDTSIELDDAPGPERIFALLSRSPLATSKVETALRALGSRGPETIRSAQKLDVPAELQATIFYEKEIK